MNPANSRDNVCTEYQKQELAARLENFYRTDYIRKHPFLTKKNASAFNQHWRKFIDGKLQPSQAKRERKSTPKWPKTEEEMVQVLRMPAYQNVSMAKKQMLARTAGDKTGKGARFMASIGWIKGVLKRNADKIAGVDQDQEDEQTGVTKQARLHRTDTAESDTAESDTVEFGSATDVANCVAESVSVDGESGLGVIQSQNPAKTQDPAKLAAEAQNMHKQGHDLQYPLQNTKLALEIWLETPGHDELDVAAACNNIGSLLKD